MADFITSVKEKIPGTEENKTLVKSEKAALAVMRQWEAGEQVYHQIRNRVSKNRDFYLGKTAEQFNSTTTEGNLRIVTNVGATVIDLIVYLLSNSPPTVQATPRTTGDVSQAEASAAEDLANKMLRSADFHRKFRDSCWTFSIAGFVWWFPFWNTDTKFGRKENKFDFSLLSPFRTRVFYEDTDYDKIPYFVTTKRMTPEAIYELYEIENVREDRENVFLPLSIQGVGIEDGKTTVFKKYDGKNVITVIDNIVRETEEHGLDFAPIIQANNKFVINDPHGHDDVSRMRPVAQELNMLISATSEIARDLGWPALLEYNGALNNRKLPKLRGVKIPVRRTDKGEALEFLANPAEVGPLLNQIQMLLDLFHFVSLMPKAAAGVFDSSVTSGFQARIAMQPATLSTENKRIDFDDAIVKLVKTGLYLIEKNDPKSLEIDEDTRLVDLQDLEFKVVWPDNLPIDIAREVQNLILGIQNSLTSVTQAVDKYNVLMGMGSTEETISYLEKEADDETIAPERALKVANVKQALQQIQDATEQMRAKLNTGVNPEDVLPGGNATNAARANSSRLPEEQQVPPDTAREAVTPESTGGVVV